MPNPKAGCIVPPKGSTKLIVEKLQKTIRLVAKNNEPAVRCAIGKESMKDEEIAENFMAAYTVLINSLPMHDQNIKNVSLKLTMSRPVIVGDKK
jgi:ribosomal protein L1